MNTVSMLLRSIKMVRQEKLSLMIFSLANMVNHASPKQMEMSCGSLYLRKFGQSFMEIMKELRQDTLIML